MKKRIAYLLVCLLMFASVSPAFAESIRVRVEGLSKTHYDEIYELIDEDATAEDILDHSVNVSSAGAITYTTGDYGRYISDMYGDGMPMMYTKDHGVYVALNTGLTSTPDLIEDELLIHMAPSDDWNLYVPDLDIEADGNDVTLHLEGTAYPGTFDIADATLIISSDDPSFSPITLTTDANGEAETSLDLGVYTVAVSKESQYGPRLLRADLEIDTKTANAVIGLIRNDLYDNARSDHYAIAAYNQLDALDYDDDARRTLKETYADFEPTANYGSEYLKAFVALTAAGIDPTDVYGRDLVSQFAALSLEDVTGSVNQAAAALQAVNTHSLSIDASSDVNEDALVQYLLSMQGDSGGWVYSGKGDGFDTGGLVVSALAPYYTSNATVKAALDKFADYVSDNQLANGGVSDYGFESAATTAQVIMGLCAMGNDITDSKFTSDDDLTLLDHLLSFYDADEKRFYYVYDGSKYIDESFSTPQAFSALVAYQAQQKSDAAVLLLDFNNVDYVIEKETPAYDTVISSLMDNYYDSKALRPDDYYVDGAYTLMGNLDYTEDERTAIFNAYKDFAPSENYGTSYFRAFSKLVTAGIDPSDMGLVKAFGNLSFSQVAATPNQAIWSLLALDTHALTLDSGSNFSREDLVDYILSMQGDQGGWAYNAKGDDYDTAGAAMMALAPYADARSDVQSAIDKCVNWISNTQKSDGTIEGPWGASGATTAQVIMGLSANGISAEGPLFTKNDKTLVDQLLTFYNETENRFFYTYNGTDYMDEGYATPQGFAALVAHKKLEASNTAVRLFDYTDTELTPVRNVEFNITTSFKVGSTANASALVAGKMLTATVAVEMLADADESDQDVIVIVALYDANRIMKNVSFAASNIARGQSQTLHAGFLLPSDVTGYQAKAFVWEGTDLDNTGMILSEDVTLN